MAESYEQKILKLLSKRFACQTICPSEVLPKALKQDKQRMLEIREAAKNLVRQGKIEIVQRGHIVDPDSIRGPIRLRSKDLASP